MNSASHYHYDLNLIFPPDMGKQCRFRDEDDCYFGFAYTVRADGQLEIYTQRNKGWFLFLNSRLSKDIFKNPRDVQ